MDKTQVQKRSCKTHGKQNSRISKTRASKNKNLNGWGNVRSSQTPNNLTSNHLSSLQQSLGNKAVGRMIQAKLTIGEPDDKYEREADQVADQVMRMPEPAGNEDDETTIQAKPIANQITPLVQREQEEQTDEDESLVQMMSEEVSEQEEEETIAAKPLLQRQAESGMDEEEPLQTKPYIQRQANEDDEELLQTKPITHQNTPLVQRAADEQMDEDESSVQTMSNGAPEQDEEEIIATKPLLQRQTESGLDKEESVQTKHYFQRQANEDEEEPLQTKIKPGYGPYMQRQMEESDEDPVQAKTIIQRQEVGEEEESVQMKPLSGYSPQVSRAHHISAHSVGPLIQRVCSECEEEMQRQPEEEEELVQPKPLVDQQFVAREPSIQPKGVHRKTPHVSSATAANIHSLKGGGSPLPRSVRSFFEPRFGTDFSQVRVHTGSRATETAKSINARAFTIGGNIAFGAGQYSPESQAGKQLLGHELTHVVQQTQGNAFVKRYLATCSYEPMLLPARSKSPSTPARDHNALLAGVRDWPVRLLGDNHALVIQRQSKRGTASKAGPADKDSLKEKVRFTFKVDRGLPSAKAKKEGVESLVWFAQNIYRVSENEARNIIARGHWIWVRDFTGRKIGETVSELVPLGLYLKGLVTVYGPEHPHLKSILIASAWSLAAQSPQALQQKLTPTYLENLAEVVKIQALVTPTEYRYFELWAKRRGFKQLDLAKATPLQLERLKKALKKFIDNKYKHLKQMGKFEDYLQEKDPEAHYGFQTLKDKIFKIDKKLIKEFTELTGLSISDLLLATPVSGAVKGLAILGLDRKLAKVGVSIQDFARLLYIFRQKALSKVISLLVQTEQIVAEETARYKKKRELDKLLQAIMGEYGPKFDEADVLRAKGLIRYFKAGNFKPNAGGNYGVYGGEAAVMLFNHIYKIKDVKEMTIWTSFYPAGLFEKILARREFDSRKINPNRTERERVESDLGRRRKYAHPDELEKKIVAEFPEFSQAKTKDAETYQKLRTTGAEEFKVLADIHTDWRSVSRKKKKDIKKYILKMLKEKKRDAAKTKRKLIKDPDLIWELQPVVLMTMQDLQIDKSGKVGTIIWDKVKDVKTENIIRSLGLAALSIVLGILGFFTGGATWVGAAAIAGGITVSAIDLYYEAKSYGFHSAAAEAAFAEALSVKPSAFGVAMAIFGLVLDVVDVVKATANLVKSSSEAISVLKGADEIEEAAAKSYDDLNSKGALKEGITKAEFVAKVKATALAEAKVAKSYPEAFDKLVGGLKLNRRDKFGLFRIYDTHPNTCEAIVKALAKEPAVLKRLARHAVKDPNVTGSYLHIQKILGDEAGDVFRYFGSEGADAIGTLPDVLAVIIRGKITDKVLVKEVLINRKLHTGIINTADGPARFNELWKAFNKKKAEGATYDFATYVGYRGIKTKPSAAEFLTVAQEMGVDFFTKSNLKKNLALLERTEPKLAAELAKPVAKSALSPDLHVKLNKLLESDIIGKQNIYAKARGKVVRKVNDLVGVNVKDYGEFKTLMKRTQTGGSRGALGEATAKKFNIPPGAASGKKVTVKVKGLTHPDWPGGEVQVIIDNFNARTKKIGEIKVGTSFDEDQFKRYAFFLKYQKNLEKRLIEAGVPKGQINGISYGLIPGPDDIVAVEKATQAGQKIADPVKIRAEKLWAKLSQDAFIKDRLEMHFVTVTGSHYKITKTGKVTHVKKVK